MKEIKIFHYYVCLMKQSKKGINFKMRNRLRCFRNRCYGLMEINKEQLDKKVELGAVLIDVRSPQEFQEGHLKNAILLPEYEIKENVSEILPDKSQTIIVYCSTGHRGIKAQRLLQKMGYQQVYNLYNGLENYE